MAKWTFGKALAVTFDDETLAITVKKGERTFQTIAKDPYVSLKDGKKLLFTDAATRKTEAYPCGVGDGILATFSDFPENSISFALYLWVEESIGRLHAEWVPYTESEAAVQQVAWPQPFASFAPGEGYAVMNLMNGKLIPDDSEEEIHPCMSRMFLAREGYMPFWGQVGEGGSGYLAIVETPWDAAYQYDHMPKSPTVVGMLWLPSLGKMDYRRKIAYDFYEAGADYVRMCKDYRQYTVEHGHFVSLKEKIIKNPLVGKMVGGAVVHTPMICVHIQPGTHYYDADHPEKNDRVIPFSDMAQKIERLHDLGVEGAYVHLDGWGKRGYDNLHPDLLPPCEQAGGWAGMADYVARLRRIGFIPAIHDNYRDYYLDADTYSDNQAQIHADGSYHWDAIWHGGKQRKMCADLAMNYVRRNFNEMAAHDCRPDGAYLDVFSVVELDECVNPMHRMTRRECVEKRCDCFEYVRSCGMVVSSEEPIDRFVDSLDLVHHAPCFWSRGPLGVDVPLFALVYHDAVLIPHELGRGGNYGVKTESGFLHALLQGNIPYLSINASEEEIAQVNIVRRLHKEVACSELLSHRFIDGCYEKQESRFACGVTVEVDLKQDTYRITWADGSVSEGKVA